MTQEKVEVVLLAWSRTAKEIKTRIRRRTLVVLTRKRTRVLDHAIRARLSLWSKLTFENTLITFINADAHKRLATQLQLELCFVVEVLRTTLPVKASVEVCIHAPGDQFGFGIGFGVVTDEPV